ncbi:MAG: response regulator transcription factor [Chitinophagaceae bacterium]|nr:response regulator transcription factor [Chitinophagaceae bacterium]
MNCIVIDDEPLAREGLRHLISTEPALQLTGMFSNVRDAAIFMEDHMPDILFLDIRMPEANGLDFARSIHSKTLVVFTTAFTEYAIESYEVDAIDYLVKPIRPERFNKTVEKAAHYLSLLKAASGLTETPKVEKEYIFVRANGINNKIELDDLHFIEGLKDYVILHVNEKKIMTNMILKEIHRCLPQKRFFRVNKSYIINIKHMSGYNNSSVFIGKQEISLSHVYKAAFLEHLHAL